MRYPAVVFLLLASFHGLVFAQAADPAGEAEPSVSTIAGAATIEDIIGPIQRTYGSSDLDPGLPPEGDYLGTPVFTNDGQRVLLTNRMTDNVTV